MKGSSGSGFIVIVLNGAGAAIVLVVQSPWWYVPIARIDVLGVSVYGPIRSREIRRERRWYAEQGEARR